MHRRLLPKGVCQRCGFEYPLNALRKEWTGLRVCADDFDPRPAELRAPRYKPEGLILPNASPEPEPVFGHNYWHENPAVPGLEVDWFLLLSEDFTV